MATINEPLILENDWQIAERFRYDTGKETELNSRLLEALHGGLQSPTIEMDLFPDPNSLQQIFKDVELKYISVFFHFNKNFSNKYLEKFLDDLCLSTKINPLELNGGIISYSVSEISLSDKYPNFKTMSVSAEIHQENAEPDKILAELLVKVNNIVNSLPAENQRNIFDKIMFSVEIGKDYLLEIAKLRAIYLLWGNFQLARGISEAIPPFINVEFYTDAYDEDENKNMIIATTLAMAAVIGGGSRVTVRPAGTDESSFHRRIARNVLHLLDLESGLKYISDPAAGSYYIEKMTQAIADSAWTSFLGK